MTRRISDEVARREMGYKKKPKSMAERLGIVLMARALERGAGRTGRQSWPDPKWQKDPVGFFRTVLGIKPWSRQIEMIEAIRDHDRVAICAGQKVAKTCTIVGVALWYFSSFPNAQVIISSTTARQVDEIVWLEMRIRHSKALVALDGQPADRAATGLRSDDFRKIVGFTARQAEAVAGVSGTNLLYLIDEASGVPDMIFDAIKGNRMGGARIVMLGNPTKNKGEFFDAFHSKSKLWKTLRVSSEESPNVVEGKDVIPGLANRRTIREYEEEYGRDSAWFQVRVLGQFATKEEGKVISIAEITDAELRWETASATGLLCIGIDPAGEGGKGDESAFAFRRGMKCIGVEARRGMNEDDHLAYVQGIIKEHGLPGEVPRVLVDSEGTEGARVYARLKAEAESKPYPFRPFDLIRIRSSDNARREPLNFDKLRDELWENARRWIRAGGAIPTDKALENDLHAPEFLLRVGPKTKVTSKPELRKALGRSPDKGDAFCLCIWEPSDHAGRVDEERRAPKPSDDDRDSPGLDVWAAAEQIDPYAGR